MRLQDRHPCGTAGDEAKSPCETCINACLRRRMKRLIFCPGMTNDIRQFVEACSTFAHLSDKHAVKPILQHEVTQHPWEQVGTGRFSFKGGHTSSPLTTTALSLRLNTWQTLSTTVIGYLKQHFARHGIPDAVISDGAPSTPQRP